MGRRRSEEYRLVADGVQVQYLEKFMRNVVRELKNGDLAERLEGVSLHIKKVPGTSDRYDIYRKYSFKPARQR